MFELAMSSNVEHLIAATSLPPFPLGGGDARSGRRYYRFDVPLATLPAVSETNERIVADMVAQNEAYLDTEEAALKELAALLMS